MPVRVLVVGGGHASLPLLAHAREMTRLGAQVTLLTDAPDLWYSGMTPEWLGGVYTHADVTVPLAPLCDREGVALHVDRCAGLDRAAREVVTAGGARLGYDVVAFDVGGLNPARDAAGPAIHTKPLHRVEALGDALDGAAGRGESMSVVIVGGGAAGVEVALNVSARPDFRGRLTLVEPGGRLAAGLPAAMGRGVARTLRDRGVALRFDASADSVDADGVHLDGGEVLAADAVLWATGTVGQPFFGQSGLAVTEAGFVRVGPSLRAQDDARVFVAGDAAAVRGHEGLARVGVHAVKQGPVLRANVRRTVEALARGAAPGSARLRAFRPYPVTPLIVSTGAATAWLAVGPLAFRSPLWLALKHAVDRRWIDRYRPSAAASYPRRADLAAAADPGGPADASARG